MGRPMKMVLLKAAITTNTPQRFRGRARSRAASMHKATESRLAVKGAKSMGAAWIKEARVKFPVMLWMQMQGMPRLMVTRDSMGLWSERSQPARARR